MQIFSHPLLSVFVKLTSCYAHAVAHIIKMLSRGLKMWLFSGALEKTMSGGLFKNFHCNEFKNWNEILMIPKYFVFALSLISLILNLHRRKYIFSNPFDMVLIRNNKRRFSHQIILLSELRLADLKKIPSRTSKKKPTEVELNKCLSNIKFYVFFL